MSFAFCGLLALLFIGLKLAAFITWSWWWVLAPLWIGLPLTLLVIIGIAFLIAWANS
ncbi:MULTISPECIES: hypothetical protein [unclassified Caulobacter]|uniref:hypothetical protein n=1 Tax=unclassified Caulobacter TaxID=2648921 RepID=UPI0018EE4B71|nr:MULTISPECIES: hypothetical protein [unclassified Caulobacter]